MKGLNMIMHPQVKPLDPAKLDRIATGAMCGMKKQGYGRPVRKVRVHARKKVVTLPSYVARELMVEAGNSVVWCETEDTGALDIAEVLAVYELDIDGTPILGRQVAISKVRKSSGSYELTIPKVAQAKLGDVTDEKIAYMFTNYPGVVTVCVVKRPGDQEGSRREG